MTTSPALAFRFNQSDKRLLKGVARRLAMPQSEVMRFLVRQAAAALNANQRNETPENTEHSLTAGKTLPA